MKILLVEDDEPTRRGILLFLRAEGHEVTSASSGLEALSCLNRAPHDLVLSDVRMPGIDGLTLVGRLRAEGNEIPIVMMTAFATVEEAVKALQTGADDYVTKPLNLDELAVRIERIAWKLSLVRENRQLRDRLERVESRHMVGAGRAIQEIRKSLDRLADDPDVPVMIYGESGTGKELIARTIHSHSARSKQPFIDVCCAAFPEELLDSELFGYRKGAFTGAFRDKVGIFQAAHRGTLFLDEVSEMSPRMQSKLLRVLQEHTIVPVGATSSVAVNVRVVGASNQDLYQLVKTGKFREDLYYRMNVVEIRLAPLRERVEDIPPLAAHFIEKHSGVRRRPLRLSAEAYECLSKYPWPGNVRELENLVRVLLVSCDEDETGVEDLPARFRAAPPAAAAGPAQEGDQADYHSALQSAVAAFEEDYIRRHLARNDGNISRTAAAIGLSRVALHKKLKQYRLTQ